MPMWVRTKGAHEGCARRVRTKGAPEGIRTSNRLIRRSAQARFRCCPPGTLEALTGL